ISTLFPYTTLFRSNLRGHTAVIEAIQNIFNIPDLRKRIAFMLALLAVYRIGAHIPTPGIDSEALANFFAQNQGTVFGFLDLFSGGNFRRLTIFALGIMPYITALIIFAGIVVGLPRGILDVYEKIQTNEWSVLTLIILVALMVAVVAFIVLVERGQRRITVQYAKRVVGRRVLGGQSTHLPLRVNTGGVIPVIFASSILTFPQTFGLVVRENRFLSAVTDALRFGEPLYNLLYVLGIIFFCYFYTSIIFNPNEVAD